MMVGININPQLVIVLLPFKPDTDVSARAMAEQGVLMLFATGWSVRIRRRATGPWEVSFPLLPGTMGVYIL